MITRIQLLLFAAMLVIGVLGGSNNGDSNGGSYGDNQGSYGSSGGSYGKGGGDYGQSADEEDGKSFGLVSFLQQFDFGK